jgi:hypothetical protein
MKYIYSPHHLGLVLAPLMTEPNQKDYWLTDPAFIIFNHVEFNAANEAYNTWLSSPPAFKVRPEDIEWFSVERGEDEFEVRIGYNGGKGGYEEKYSWAIPKKGNDIVVSILSDFGNRIAGNESKEQSPSVGKTYEINFAGNILCKLKVSGDTIEVEAAMNGWGDSIPLLLIEVIEIENSPTL